MSLIVASTDHSVELAAANMLDEFLQYSFLARDDVIRVSPHKWLVLVERRDTTSNALIDQVRQAWHEANQLRPCEQRMPTVHLEVPGT